MSAWTDLGLPLPNAKLYGYVRDAGIVRSPTDSAMPEQKQASEYWVKTFTISWDLTLPQLALAEAYLLEFGYSWFDLEMTSSETGVDEIVSIHTIRLTENYKITPIGSMYMKLSSSADRKIMNLPPCVPVDYCHDFTDGNPSASCDFKG